jgi:hypothetical protein
MADIGALEGADDQGKCREDNRKTKKSKSQNGEISTA